MRRSRKLILFLPLAVMLVVAVPLASAAPAAAGTTRDRVHETVTWTMPAGQCQGLDVTVDGTGQRDETTLTTTRPDGSQQAIIDDVVAGTALDHNGLAYAFYYANHSVWDTPASGSPVAIKMNDLFLLQNKTSEAQNRYVLKVAFVWRWTYDPNTAAYWPPVDNLVQTHTLGDPYNCDPI